MKTVTSFAPFKSAFFRIVAVATLLLLAGAQKVQARDQTVPWGFDAITTVIWEQVDPGDSTHTTEIHIGTGHSTHLGAVSVVVVNQVYEVLDPIVGPALSISGQAILTGSDGSTLTFLLETLVPYNPPTFPFHSTISVTGGTGKLSGVSGTGAAEGHVDAAGAFHFDATGRLALDKRGK